MLAQVPPEERALRHQHRVLPGTSCLPGVVLLLKPFPLIRVCLYAVKQLLTLLQSRLEGEGLVQVVLLRGFF